MIKVIFALVLIPSILFAQPVQKKLITLDVEVTGIDATPDYSANDLMGDKLTILGGVREGVFSGKIQNVAITDKETLSVNKTLWIFSSDPTGITFTDNGTFSIVDADIEKVICAIPITTHQVTTASSIGYANNVGCAFSLGTSQTLYAAIEAEATANMATADDLHLRLTIEKD
jgi:hypothetical protein